MKSDVCGNCGKLINAEYHYCPWCGFSRIQQYNKTSINLRYEQFKKLLQEKRRRQLMEMESRLNDLEKELSVLVLSAEMHK